MFMQDGTYLTPKFANSWVSSAMPPGLSDTTTESLNERPSAANPLSITRPRTVESMLPPQRGKTTLNQKNDTEVSLKAITLIHEY